MTDDSHDAQITTTSAGALQALTENLAMSFWGTDEELRLISICGAPFLLNGKSRIDLIGHSLRDLAAENEALHDICQMHERALSGQAGWFGVRHGGRTYEGRVAPCHGEGGRAAGCLSFAYESSGYKSSSTELERLFSLSRQMLCIAGTDGYFKRVNPAFEKVLGYSTAEVLSTPFVDLVHPNDREATIREVEKLAAGLPTVHFENRYRCKDGSYKWMAWTSSPAQTGDLLYASALDITEQKRAERFFREVVDSAPDAVVIADAHGTILLVNRLSEELFGYSREELRGKPLEILVPDRFQESHVGHRENYRENPQIRPMGSGIEVRGQRKDGTEFPAEISLAPLDIEGEMVVMSAVRDITLRKAAERKLRESEAELLAAEQIQKHILPTEVPEIPGFDFAGETFPAHFAGGDLLDYIPLPDGSLGLVLGDVTGHGIAAGLVMANTHAYIHSFAEREIDASKILARANKALCHATEPERFVTTVFARLDPRAKTLCYASAGHPSGFVIDRDGGVKRELESTGIPLGILPEAEYPACLPFPLAPGDTVVLLSDGLVEAEAPNGDQFGSERMLTVLRDSRREPARNVIRALHTAVREFTEEDEFADDVTVIVIKVEQSD